jgi:cytochrome c1
MNHSIKYLIKTDSNKTYILHIMDAVEYKRNQYVGLFLFHDEEIITDADAWPNLRHRLLFESSVEAIKDKVTEYAHGRNENITFIDNYSGAAA